MERHLRREIEELKHQLQGELEREDRDEQRLRAALRNLGKGGGRSSRGDSRGRRRDRRSDRWLAGSSAGGGRRDGGSSWRGKAGSAAAGAGAKKRDFDQTRPEGKSRYLTKLLRADLPAREGGFFDASGFYPAELVGFEGGGGRMTDGVVDQLVAEKGQGGVREGRETGRSLVLI